MGRATDILSERDTPTCRVCRRKHLKPTGDFEPREGYIALRFECMDCGSHEVFGMLKITASSYRKAYPDTIWVARPLVKLQ